MKPTILNGVNTRAVTEDGLVEWVNREAVPLLQSLRGASNYWSKFNFSVDTLGDGVATEIWESDELPTSGIWVVKACIAAFPTEPSTDDAVYYDLEQVFQTRDGGAVNTVGAGSIGGFEYSEAFGVTLSASASRTISLSVSDNAVVACRWRAVVSVLELTPT